MAQVFNVRLRGLRQVQQRLNEFARRNPRGAQSALRTVGEIDMTEMKKRTPVDLGNLRGTGRVEETGGIGIRWAFGGTTGTFPIREGPRRGQVPFVDYAVVVHENIRARHKTGRSKYMESVLVEEFPNYPRRIGEEWAREMGLA